MQKIHNIGLSMIHKKVVLNILLGLSFLFYANVIQAQEVRFSRDIQAFKKQDSIKAPPQNAILLIGSSSFTNWKNVQSDFPDYSIINRGFGGSTLQDLIYHFDDIVIPYNPKQVIIYCGENDFAESDTVSSATVFNRFKKLYSMLRTSLGDVDIAYVSNKPSPSRQHLLSKMAEANRLIENFITKENNIEYIDVFSEMLEKDGSPKKEIFLEDQLHMNEKGYAIWINVIKPYLKPLN